MNLSDQFQWEKHQYIYNKYIKRSFDFAVASLVLILTSPILLFVMILIKLDSNGPALFQQTRIGKNNKEFTIYKLRTMNQNMYNEKHEKIRDRDRVTKVGKIVRKLSLDELPQLINIVKGEMSFIGPRPLLVRYLPYYNDHEIKRHSVLPGITGLAQINGRSFLNWEERFDFDVTYVHNISFVLDVKILYKTLVKVLKGEGTSTIRPPNLVDFDKHRGFKRVR